MKLPIIDDATTSFPELHRTWVAGAIGRPIPREVLATCETCAMLAPEGETRNEGYFEPDVKCCSYIPKVPSFLVGMLLADEDPAMNEGRARMRARIEKRIAVSPIGVVAPSQFGMLYKPGSGSFGRSRALRCPYYAVDEGGCTIWKHRNAICATWFCKHTRGKRGEDFWKALALMLTEAEKALIRHCILELDIGIDATRILFPHPHDEVKTESLDDLDGRVDDARYRAQWGTWHGREEEFYVAAASIVRPLRWGDVMRIGGSELAVRARIAAGAYVALVSHALPERVKVGSLGITSMRDGASRVMTYSRYDPLDLPNELLPLLGMFDGVKVEEARRRIEEEHGIVLDDDLLRKLVDFGVLVAD